MQIAGATMERFKFLPKVAWVVLVLPHSNADLERLFSKEQNWCEIISEIRWHIFFHFSYDIKVSRISCTMLQIATRLSYD